MKTTRENRQELRSMCVDGFLPPMTTRTTLGVLDDLDEALAAEELALAQRDEAVRALEEIADNCEPVANGTDTLPHFDRSDIARAAAMTARAAIAKLKGGTR